MQTLLAVLTLLALVVHPAAPPSTPDTGIVEVILVRHAEPLADGGNDPDLSADGQARARCLVDELRDRPVTHVFTSAWQRTKLTAEPLASDRKLESVVRDPMAAKALADELASLPAGSRALVVGHSNTLPLLAKALGFELGGLVEEAGQPTLPRAEHDRLVTLRLRAGAAAGDRLVASEERRYACKVEGP